MDLLKVQGDEMQSPLLFIYQSSVVLLFLTHAQKFNMIIKLVNVSLMRVANFLSVPSPSSLHFLYHTWDCLGCGEVGGYGAWKEVDQSMKIKAEGRGGLWTLWEGQDLKSLLAWIFFKHACSWIEFKLNKQISSFKICIVCIYQESALSQMQNCA